MDRNAEFRKLAQEQRGAPEAAMLRCQHLLGGGVLSYTLEHVGDLTHRMAQYAELNDFGREDVLDKTTKCLRVLRQPYGFHARAPR